MAYGAQGGGATVGGHSGGTGAIIGGTFALTAGETLDLFIGGQGVSALDYGGGGGDTS